MSNELVAVESGDGSVEWIAPARLTAEAAEIRATIADECAEEQRRNRCEDCSPECAHPKRPAVRA